MNMRQLILAGSVGAISLIAAQLNTPTVQTVVRLAGTGGSAADTQYLVALPHIAYGDAWRTQIVVSNTSNAAAEVSLYYYGDDGTPLNTPISGVSSDHSTLTVPANGQQVLEPDWQAATSTGGWAGLVYTNAGVKIQGVFLWHNPADVPEKYTEAAAPIINQSGAGCLIPLPGIASYTLPYDETEGRFSGYGFANTISSPVIATLKFYDQNGQVLGQYSKQLAAFGHDQMLVRDKLPQLVGTKGTMVVGGQGVVPLGFRFTPHYTFTTWQP